MENKQFLSLPEAAARMGISRIAVFKKVKNGRLPGIRIGRNWAVPAEAVPTLRAGEAARTSPPPAAGTAITPAARRPPDHGTAPEPAPESDPLDEMGWD